MSTETMAHLLASLYDDEGSEGPGPLLSTSHLHDSLAMSFVRETDDLSIAIAAELRRAMGELPPLLPGVLFAARAGLWRLH